MSQETLKPSQINRTAGSTSAAGPMVSSVTPQFLLLRVSPAVTATGSFVTFEDWDYLAIPEPQTTSGETLADSEHVDPPSSSSAIMELRRLTGFTWEQLATLFKVARRSLHFWASGKPLNAANEQRLHRTLGVVHTIDRGSSSENRALLLREHDGVIPFDLLAQEKYTELVELVGAGSGRPDVKLAPLSREARDQRRPLPPKQLVGALQDPAHRDVGKARRARTTKSKKK